MQSKDLLNQMLFRSLSGAAFLLLSPTLPAKVYAFTPRLDAHSTIIHAISPADMASLSSTPHNTVPKIVGIVTDSSTGEPLIGATIKLVGSTTGTVTDTDGRFEIRAAKGATLEVSYLGYTSKKVKVTDVKVLSITLSDQAQVLEGA